MLQRFRNVCLLIPCLLATAIAKPVEVIDLEPVWSTHPVGFCLVTHPPFQFAAYYDAERRMTVAQRRLDSKEWTFQRLPSQLGWDSHNYVTLTIDPAGHLHVSGNMHNVPLVYFRSGKPLDAASLRPVKSMTGDREAHVTYPVFLRDRAKRLVFRYRDGGSGRGDDLYNVYHPATKSWCRLVPGPLISGEGERSAYATEPVAAPDGTFHMVWVWRDTLLPVPGAKPLAMIRPLPRDATKLRSTFAGMGVRTASDSGTPPEGVRYQLVWETLGANRDQPRTPPLPAASMLRVVEW